MEGLLEQFRRRDAERIGDPFERLYGHAGIPPLDEVAPALPAHADPGSGLGLSERGALPQSFDLCEIDGHFRASAGNPCAYDFQVSEPMYQMCKMLWTHGPAPHRAGAGGGR